MSALLRMIVGAVLVLLIVVIVASPCVDLPLTTLCFQQAAASLFAAAVSCAVVLTVMRRAQVCVCLRLPAFDSGVAPGVTCVLLC